MGGLLSQPAPQPPQSQLPGPGSPGATGGVPGLGITPPGGDPGLGVLQQPAMQPGVGMKRPADELSEQARAQRVSGVFGAPGAGGGQDVISQLLASIGPLMGGSNAPNVPGSIIGGGAGFGENLQLGATPGGINIDPVVAAIVQAYQQMTQQGRQGESTYERPAPQVGAPEPLSSEMEASLGSDPFAPSPPSNSA